jgi:hypothetical protein
MNVIDAIHDANLFRSYVTGADDGSVASWRNWITFLKVLYGLKPTKSEHDLIKQCTGRDPGKLSKDGYTECLLLCGRRSGKSKTIALVGAYEAVLSGREAKLSKGEIPMVAILSPTRFQSRIIFTYLKAVFDSSPMLQDEVEEERREGFKLKNGVEIAIVTGNPATCRGFSVIAAIVDEIAMFGLSEESHVRSDTELVRALRPSLGTTGGRLLCVGTPWAAMGYAYQTWKRSFGNDDCDVLTWNAPSTVMNPTLSPGVVQRAIDEDAVAANVEYCVSPGLFREDVEAYISRATVENIVVRGRLELPPRAGLPYCAFADVSGGRHDDAALAIAHKEDRVIVLDCLERFKAPHDPHIVVAEMASVLKRYGCDRAVGDAYAAEWSRTTFAQHGITYNRASTSVWKEGAEAKTKVAKPKAILYAELLPRLTSAEVELLDNELLITQLSLLQRRTRSGARDSIDHPPGGHDDLANCLAGVADSCMNRRMTAGVIGGGDLYTQYGRRSQSPMERALENLQHLNDYERDLARQGEDHGSREWRELMMRTGRVHDPLRPIL